MTGVRRFSVAVLTAFSAVILTASCTKKSAPVAGSAESSGAASSEQAPTSEPASGAGAVVPAEAAAQAPAQAAAATASAAPAPAATCKPGQKTQVKEGTCGGTWVANRLPDGKNNCAFTFGPTITCDAPATALAPPNAHCYGTMDQVSAKGSTTAEQCGKEFGNPPRVFTYRLVCCG